MDFTGQERGEMRKKCTLMAGLFLTSQMLCIYLSVTCLVGKGICVNHVLPRLATNDISLTRYCLALPGFEPT